MTCPYFKEGYFGICVAPDAIHVPDIAEMQSFCLRSHYELCPSFSVGANVRNRERISRVSEEGKFPGRAKLDIHSKS